MLTYSRMLEGKIKLFYIKKSYSIFVCLKIKCSEMLYFKFPLIKIIKSLILNGEFVMYKHNVFSDQLNVIFILSK